MDDLISRSWLLDVIENVIQWDTEKDRNRAIHQVRELTPAVQQEQKVGEWISRKDGLKYWFSCSCCTGRFNYEWKYCPNCGAKMERG